MLNKILIILSFFLILSCTKSNNLEEIKNLYEDENRTDYELFESANNQLKSNKLNLALETLDKIEVIYPNSKYASKAKLTNAYIHFLKQEYEKTKAIANNFINYYPGNEDLVYAYYLDAMTHYIIIRKPDYDQKDTMLAKEKFNFILNAYPDSEYAKDIILKINVLDNAIANHYLLIGKFYNKKNNYAAALNYYNEIYENHSESLSIEETLYLMTKTYLEINENTLALKYGSILGYNYPNSDWYNKSYNLIKKIDEDVVKDKWYQKLNPVKIIKKNIYQKNEKTWYEPEKPKFKLF